MAQKKKGGLIERMMWGKEKSEGYARASLPSNRWELFWDIFKGRFSKLFVVNLLVFLFFIPLIALFVFRYMMVVAEGTMYPFMQVFGPAYGAPTNMVGYAETILFRVDLLVYLFLPLALMIAAVGISGGAYVIRNMVWTEGIFVSNDFWRGIKQNIKQMLTIFLIYGLVFYITVLSGALCNLNIATTPDKKWLFIISQVISYAILIIYSIMTLHMVAMCVTYELKTMQLIKNSFYFMLGLLPQNIFFVVLGLLPFLLCWLLYRIMGVGGLAIGVILVLILGFSLFLLIWTDFCQWAYDRFVNDKVPGAQKNRGIYEKIKESDSGALKQYREQLAMAQRCSLNSRPIKPITDDELKVAELPTSFNRADLEKLRESKQAIYDDYAKYVEEHKNDPEFQLTEEEKELQKAKEEREKRIEKAKKELSKRKNK